MFHFYYHNHRSRFDQLFLGSYTDPKLREDFWTELEQRGDKRLENHWVKNCRNWKTNTIPISLHGDAVPVFKVGKAGTESYDVYSMQSCWISDKVMLAKLFIFGIFASIAIEETWAEVWREVVWSLFWLSQGTWPKVDKWGNAYTAADPLLKRLAGKPLADGFCAIVYALKADLDHFAKDYKLRHYNSNDMCDYCPATRRETDRTLLYNNFDTDARWPSKLFTVQEWRDLYAAGTLHYLFGLPGVTNMCIESDELHVLYLGVAQYFLGSLLFAMVFQCGEDKDEQMKKVWGTITMHYEGHTTETQYTSLSIGSFCDADKPDGSFQKWRGRGAECKDLLPAAYDALLQHGGSHGSFDDMQNALARLLDIRNCLHVNKHLPILPKAAAKLFKTRTVEFLRIYQHFASTAERQGLLM